MRVLILGVTGMLGHVACRILSDPFEVHAACRSRADWEAAARAGAGRCIVHAGFEALDDAAVIGLVKSVRPDVVLNCVGVVKQRPEAGDARLSIRINALLPHVIAAACGEVGAKVIQVSTDCVFSGRRGRYTEDDTPDPEDLYGRSKLLGEVVSEPHLTIRTSIIGRQLRDRTGLLEWFRSQRGSTVRGFTRAIFSGLTTAALSDAIVQVLQRHSGLWGLYHVAAVPISKDELLRRINARLGLDVRIEPEETFACDRSLDATRFLHDTGILIPGYDAMIERLAEEEHFYD